MTSGFVFLVWCCGLALRMLMKLDSLGVRYMEVSHLKCKQCFGGFKAGVINNLFMILRWQG